MPVTSCAWGTGIEYLAIFFVLCYQVEIYLKKLYGEDYEVSFFIFCFVWDFCMLF